jgi:hypothetical protein
MMHPLHPKLPLPSSQARDSHYLITILPHIPNTSPPHALHTPRLQAHGPCHPSQSCAFRLIFASRSSSSLKDVNLCGDIAVRCLSQELLDCHMASIGLASAWSSKVEILLHAEIALLISQVNVFHVSAYLRLFLALEIYCRAPRF